MSKILIPIIVGVIAAILFFIIGFVAGIAQRKRNWFCNSGSCKNT